MPKKIDYPRASLKNSLQLAAAVDDLGGECTFELAADKLNKKVSGAFHALVGATAKYDLVASKSGRLSSTELYRDYKLAYSSEEQEERLQQAFLNPPIFSDLAKRFDGRELPVSNLEKMLIREYDVPDNFASRAVKYFIEGAKQCGLLGAGNILSTKPADEHGDASDGETDSSNTAEDAKERHRSDRDRDSSTVSDGFAVRITGPGLNSNIEINDEADLSIVDAMLNKVRKRIADMDTSSLTKKEAADG